LKVVYHHRTRGDGAEGIHIREMIEALTQLGCKVTLVCPSSSRRELGISLGMTGVTSRETTSVKGRFKLFLIQSMELMYNAVSFFRLVCSILIKRPDFVYERYSCYHFGGVAACRLLGVPLVLEVNSTYAGRFNRRELAFPRICKWIEDWVLRRSRLVCVVSDPLRQCVSDRNVPSDRTLVTPNAVNPSQLIRDPQVGNSVRAELGIDVNSVVIGFVGSLRRWHGIEFLAGAIPKIIKDCPDCVFLIVGSGELESNLKLSLKNEILDGKVKFTGGIAYSRVPRMIMAMDIGLMPDSNEWGSPMKILEYMLQGKVVVAPKLEPILEIMVDGYTGVFFQRGNAEQFVEAIVRLGRNASLRSILGRNAQNFVLAERTWSANASKVIDSFFKPR
jgi:glycosyltransferase involved in cell wall biosynthesis